MSNFPVYFKFKGRNFSLDQRKGNLVTFSNDSVYPPVDLNLPYVDGVQAVTPIERRAPIIIYLTYPDRTVGLITIYDFGEGRINISTSLRRNLGDKT